MNYLIILEKLEKFAKWWYLTTKISWTWDGQVVCGHQLTCLFWKGEQFLLLIKLLSGVWLIWWIVTRKHCLCTTKNWWNGLRWFFVVTSVKDKPDFRKFSSMLTHLAFYLGCSTLLTTHSILCGGASYRLNNTRTMSIKWGTMNTHCMSSQWSKMH